MRQLLGALAACVLMFDKIYASATPNFDTRPNALLMAALDGRTPGRALDIGMGQGRNAVALAVKGWTVTGFDVSAEGLAVAKAQAARAGVAITAIQESDERFDPGTNQWDLIAVIEPVCVMWLGAVGAARAQPAATEPSGGWPVVTVHGDHMEGDAAVKALSGAQVVAMAEDVPALERMRPGGKPHPIDRVIHDGDTVTLGGTTLVAHLTPGHSRGCTTWTLKVTEGGRVLDVVILTEAMFQAVLVAQTKLVGK